jgi:very-short-patch-repair endonuclease
MPHCHPNRKFCSEPCELAQYKKSCRECGEVFIPKDARGVFCGKSCAAIWKMKQPEIVRKMIAGKDLVACGKAISEGIRRNPKEHDRRVKMGKKNFIPGWKKYNSENPTKSESVLLAIFPNAIHNFQVNTGRSSKFENAAHLYKIDVAFPNIKLAVEVDGSYHDWESQKSKDAEKDKFLISLGWFVLRFSSKAVMRDALSVKRAIECKIQNMTNQNAKAKI